MTKESFLGVDGCKEGWVGVALNTNGRFQESILVDNFSDLTKYFPNVEIIGVDMPVDLVNKPSRMADQLVRKKFVSKRGRSVFPAIPKFMIERKWIDMKADELNKESRRRLGCAFSRQTINLKNKILEVNQLLLPSLNIIEVHPELCFMKMNSDIPLEYSKKTWNGMQQRLQLLEKNGIDLPSNLGPVNGLVSPDDVIDAAAVAWTIKRFHAGHAISYPDDSNSPQIWV